MAAAHEPLDPPDGWWRPVFSAGRVRALMSARTGGVSAPPFDTCNLREGLGDAPEAVRHNRRRLHALLGMPSVQLNQVHGIAVQDLSPALLHAPAVAADASVSVHPGLACEVQAADCLPVLFADRQGRGVAAAHAGWRGLSAGVLEAALARLCAVLQARPGDIEAWLGPCIGPQAFEVGADVLQAFGAGADDPAFRSQPSHKWLADLPALARRRLRQAGVQQVAGNDGSAAWCTVTVVSRCFSYRRDGLTGRMAACIGIEP